MINLLHLSDLHFGYERDATATSQRIQVLDLLVAELTKLDSAWKPHVLVISGDLSCRGSPEGYGLLKEWLTEKLFPATGLTPANCVICPGNHDVDRKKSRSLLGRTPDAQLADEVLHSNELAEGFARPFHAFVSFAGDVGISKPMLLGAPNHLAGVLDLHGLRFVCLNSAWFCRDSQTDRGQLWLGLPQLQSMELFKPGDYDTAPVTVAVVHHPPEWFAQADCAAYGNRPAAYEYLASRSHVILCGHTHGAVARASRAYDRARVFIGGAAYDNHEYRNRFSILQIDPTARGVIHRPWELDPRTPRWEEKESQRYSLLAERLGPVSQNPTKYIAWLRDQTQFMNLHELKVGPGDAPPPAIDLLYVRLMTAAAAGGPMDRAQPKPLEEALGSRRLVIEGKPGSGKTTFARWIAWNICRPAGPDPAFAGRGIPLLVRISQLDQHIARTLEGIHKSGDPTVAADARWVPHFLASQGWDLDEAFFLGKLNAGETILLLDGLDEAASQTRREQIVMAIQLASAQYACSIVVTTRPGANEGRAALTGFENARIEDLDDAGIEGFLRQWCLWLKRGDEPAAQSYYRELRTAVTVPTIHILARNPLMLTALAVLHQRRYHLPEQRAQLYEQIMDWLADQAVGKHPKDFIKDDLLAHLGQLALGMQQWKGGQKLQIGMETAAAFLAPSFPEMDSARSFLENAQNHSGIVTLRGGEIAFWHRSFQEYLAAWKLAGLPDARLSSAALGFLYSPEGREVLPLLAGRMAASGRERLDDLFGTLTVDALAQSTLARRAHAAGVMGKMLADLAPTTYKLSGQALTRFEKLHQTVMAIFQKGEAENIGLQTRVDAAEALDQANQSRLRNPGHPDYWVRIPGDTFTIGGDPEAYRSLPATNVTLADFQIGRFPVTVWEYGAYLEETAADKPPGWDEQVGHPSRPVTRVSWHDAQRYCEWVSGKWTIRCALPTEEQWEFAARGKNSRFYPWGPEDPDSHRANFRSEGSVGVATPVGIFPAGDTPEGVADMAGNVWEWTRSDYGDGSKVVRGASFSFDASILRAANRLRSVPGDSDVYIGFRCVRE